LKTSVTILIVDDQIVVRAGFGSVLRGLVGLTVMGSVASGEEALIFLERCPVEVLLLDLRMPGLSGVETLLAVRKLPFSPKVIVLCSFERDDEILNAVETGAHGCLRKDTSPDEILEAIHTVQSGNHYLPAWVVNRISERKVRSRLSPRELEILEMVAKGLTNKEIGRMIRLSRFTVRNHVRHIMEKLEAGDRTEAATVAIQEGILPPDNASKWSEVVDKATAVSTVGRRPWLAGNSGSGEIVRNTIEKTVALADSHRRQLKPTASGLRMQ